MEELISIIIPVYNVEKYLKKCLDSVLEQTYKNLEIILVDDGSTDNSKTICDEYEKKDKRIKLIHKENGGLSDARNAGINIAKGEYITFVDSDDYISKDYVEYMYKMIKENNVKLSICGIKAVWKNTKLNNEEIHTKYMKLTAKETFGNLLFSEEIEISAYAKLYHKDLFKEIRFPKGKVYEDTAIIYKIIDLAKNVAYGDKKCYYYITRIGSISKQKVFNKNEEDYIKHTQEMLKYVLTNYPELEIAVYRFDIYSKFRILRMLMFLKPRDKKREKMLIQQIKKNQKEVYKNQRTPRRDKLAIILINLGMPIFKLNWKIYCKCTGRI